MQNQQIKCGFYDYVNKSWNQYEIDLNLKIYPCCTIHAYHQLDKTFFDEYLDSLPDDWNSLKRHSLDDILKIYREYITPEKWEKLETTPQCCKRSCLK